MIRHAGLIALRGAARWRGVLIEGPSGAGKSDLALRALEIGFRLVADDRVAVWASGARLYGRAAANLEGLIEARGLGVVAEPALRFCRIELVARAVERPGERVPTKASVTIAGVATPLLEVAALEASAAAKLRRGLDQLGTPAQASYLARLAASSTHDGARDGD